MLGWCYAQLRTLTARPRGLPSLPAQALVPAARAARLARTPFSPACGLYIFSFFYTLCEFCFVKGHMLICQKGDSLQKNYLISYLWRISFLTD